MSNYGNQGAREWSMSGSGCHVPHPVIPNRVQRSRCMVYRDGDGSCSDMLGATDGDFVGSSESKTMNGPADFTYKV